MHRTLEPYHGLVYFAPEPAAAYAALGIVDRQMGYFASRAAALGPVAAEVVIATFYNFSPDLVRRRHPGGLGAGQPRRPARRPAGRHRRGPSAGSWATPSTGDEVAEAAGWPGRPPRAAPSRDGPSTPPTPPSTGPTTPTWPCGTRSPCCGSSAATATSPAWWSRGSPAARRWSSTPPPARCRAPCCSASRARDRRGVGPGPPTPWSSAGWLDARRRPPRRAAPHRLDLEARTDALAMAPWGHLGAAGCDRLRELVRPLSRAIVDSGTFGIRPRTRPEQP